VAITALGLNCSLKSSASPSSTDKLVGEVLAALGCKAETIRVVDLNIKPGVESDEGEGDDWPRYSRKS